MEPNLSPANIVGAIFCPHDGEINPIRLTLNLERNARKCGAHFITHTPVLRIASDEAGVAGVETQGAFVRARNVVVAAGMGTPALLEPLGIHLPMLFEKGQVLVTEAMPHVLIYPTGNTRQTARGNILLGVTYEPEQTERITTLQGAFQVANDAVRRFPCLKDAKIVRQFAGIRPLPKDGVPYLGGVERLPGLYVATSHSGITLAPVHGKVISELILDGKTDVPIELYRPERFMPYTEAPTG